MLFCLSEVSVGVSIYVSCWSRSLLDVLPPWNSLCLWFLQAVSKIREFILQKIYSFRKPMTNYQIPQNTLLKYRWAPMWGFPPAVDDLPVFKGWSRKSAPELFTLFFILLPVLRRFFYQFLLANERTVAKEIRDEYVDTMSKIYYSYFKSYSSRLLKVQVSNTKPDQFTLYGHFYCSADKPLLLMQFCVSNVKGIS